MHRPLQQPLAALATGPATAPELATEAAPELATAPEPADRQPAAGEPVQGETTIDERVGELERENLRLRRILADRDLELEMLREISRGTY